MKEGYNNKELYSRAKGGEYTGEGNPQEEAAKQLGSRPVVSHYQEGAIEPIDFINANNINFNLGNSIKYITRCNFKGTKREDLLKAITYIEFELALTND